MQFVIQLLNVGEKTDHWLSVLSMSARFDRSVWYSFLYTTTTRISVLTCVSKPHYTTPWMSLCYSIYNLHCRNHSWVSFQGFSESYNDTHSLSGEQGLYFICKALNNAWWHHILSAMTAKYAADAFYNGELESEIRLLVQLAEPPCSLSHFSFIRDSDREDIMETIEAIRSTSIYTHSETDCTSVCKKRGKSLYAAPEIHLTMVIFCVYIIGCGTLWVTDGIWKIVFPHCMHRVKVCWCISLYVLCTCILCVSLICSMLWRDFLLCLCQMYAQIHLCRVEHFVQITANI